MLAARPSARGRFDPTFSFAEVLRFTGLGRRAVVDLIRAGAVDGAVGARGVCEISATSLEASLAEQATGECS